MYLSNLKDRDDWFTIWEEDKHAILATMQENMAADIAAGYNPFGNAIKKQRDTIADYAREIANTYDLFKTMAAEAVNRWCFYDLKKRGAIM